VQLGINPGLQPGHRIDAYLDGQRVVIGQQAQQFTIPDVFRGLHTMYAVIRDAGGRELRRSPEVTFMVQQTSIANPVNPQRPAPPRPTPQ
jgi:sensor domain CHASE-containing protein